MYSEQRNNKNGQVGKRCHSELLSPPPQYNGRHSCTCDEASFHTNSKYGRQKIFFSAIEREVCIISANYLAWHCLGNLSNPTRVKLFVTQLLFISGLTKDGDTAGSLDVDLPNVLRVLQSPEDSWQMQAQLLH
jgi:hypothetical protein